jgi:DNA-binding IclR family transcriptional regulator
MAGGRRREAGEDVLYPIQSVDRALLLLRGFLRRPSITVSEASEMLGVSRSTAHRLLAMLQHHGFVRQDSRNGAYLGGTTLLEIGLGTINQLDIRGAAQASLQALVDKTGETAHLVVLQDASVLFLDGRESPRALRAGLRIGAVVPAHTTSAGKAIMAAMSETELAARWSARTLARTTDRSIGSWAQLQADLAETRRRGWAINDEESEEGLRAVGVAVAESGSRSAVRAALVVAGPLGRMTHDRLGAIAQVVLSEAELVAERVRAS